MLTNIQQNVLSRIQKLAKSQVDAKAEMTQLIGMYGNEFPTPPSTVDLQSYPPFAHITTAEFVDAAGGARGNQYDAWRVQRGGIKRGETLEDRRGVTG